MKSGIYRGTVRHRRFHPVSHEFTYPLFMMYLDLDELPTVFRDRWLWSATAPAPAWFRARDYLGQGQTDLRDAVLSEAERLTGRRPTGPIRVLTHLRYFGFTMNPVSFYYCFKEDGTSLDLILAEITNTPWKERHVYALQADTQAESPAAQPHRFDKAFHISPFMPMEQEYTWRFSEPTDRLVVHMENRGERVDEGTGEVAKVFDATLQLRRQEISGRSLAGALIRYPLMTLRVFAGIYLQALKLRLKRVPYFKHPDQVSA